jgi:hypothetical protein
MLTFISKKLATAIKSHFAGDIEQTGTLVKRLKENNSL